MYGLSDRLKPLSAAEEQVLLALWDCPAPATRRDISEKLTATGWAPATVLNFLYRLEEKGWVKGGKATPCSAAACPKRSAPLPARAALLKASWNRPSGCWRSSIRRQKNMTCTIPMGDGKRKSSHYGSFFVAFGRKMC